MTNQLSKFTPHLSNITKPLCDLLSTKNSWIAYFSFDGLGAVITQQQYHGTWCPVTYCSCSLLTAGQRYTQIERRHLLLLGHMTVLVTTCLANKNRQLLVSLLGSKHFDELPIRIQRFWMRLMCYTYTISHVPEKQLTVADTLPQAPMCNSTDDTDFSNEQC